LIEALFQSTKKPIKPSSIWFHLKISKWWPEPRGEFYRAKPTIRSIFLCFCYGWIKFGWKRK